MEIADRIKQLKKEKNAVIMAHYYVPGEVQAVADYIGDSYYLSKVAEELKERIIVICGVSFMGESAKLLSPNKKVLMPDRCADCPMAHMADRETIRKMREAYDDLAVVCYINSTAELKQYADVCITSANAVKIVKALPQKYIFFIPDRNLARYVAEQAPEKTFVYNEGFCPVQEEIRPEEVLAEKERHPGALILAHPECWSDPIMWGALRGFSGMCRRATAGSLLSARRRAFPINCGRTIRRRHFIFRKPFRSVRI